MIMEHDTANKTTELNLLKLSLKQGTRIEVKGNDGLLFSHHGNFLMIENLGPSIHTVLKLLENNKYTKTELATIAFEQEGFNGLNHFNMQLDRLEKAGFLAYTLVNDNTVFCSYEQMTGNAVFYRNKTSRRFRLSKFAFIRREDLHFLLESAIGQARIVIDDPRIMGLISLLSSFTTRETLSRSLQISTLTLDAFMTLLHAGEFLESESFAPTTPEELWNFHDLLFHTRTRYGRHHYNLGATYRFIKRIPPKKASRKEEAVLAEVYLSVPNQDEMSSSKSLNQCIENRHSTRTFNGLDLHVLSILLYRCLRIKGCRHYPVTNAAGDTEEIETLSAPYPSGGSMYELVFYLTIYECEGLEPGFYQYNAFEHKLCLLQRRNKDTDIMMWYAGACIGSEKLPPAVITFAADFERMFWKYENMAYAAILKNVGAVFQTLYLVAADLGLGACAIGNGNIETLGRLTKKNILRESSVGEFILGNHQ
ncbi:SagB family peptide dehydrogenase [Chryseobacterium sp. MYb264]|uniref:SagB family peptide dehydrogenase n=1 Tax=Chryseobacterium sp. MYb264 TaxID=2745153 RepID=UPI002E14CC88|nr:SagB family peptide dehydrogenase [Chryseobacterium sp. MYb264]